MKKKHPEKDSVDTTGETAKEKLPKESCPICKSAFSGKTRVHNLKSHMKYVHWKDMDTFADLTEKMKPRTFCTICEINCGFFLKKHMEKHKKVHCYGCDKDFPGISLHSHIR